LAATHMNCAEMVGDRPEQHAYDILARTYIWRI